MSKITHSLVLIQPWSFDIVEGKMKYLVRSFNAHIRGRIGILSTRGIDKKWFDNVHINGLSRKLHHKSQIIGSVDFVNVIECSPENIQSQLKKLGGNKYLKYYPEYFIPRVRNGKKLYIWIFDNAKKWQKPVLIFKRYGMQWCELEIKDEN